MAIEVTEADFEKEVLKSKEPVLVDFWAVWCNPCQKLAPIVDEISKSGKIKVVKVDVDKNRKISEQYRILSIPTLIIFKNGKPFESKTNPMSKQQLEMWIDAAKR